VSSDLPEPPLSGFTGGPAREVLDWLYRFVAAIELSPSVAVHSQDRKGVVRFWNHACAELTGIPAGEAIGQPFVKLVKHLGKQQEFDDTIASVWRTGEAVKAREWHVELRDGRRLWLHSSHFPIPEDGETRQVFCMEVDVTARKELEDSLRQAGQVFDHARDAILLVDREHRVLAVNRAYTELTGYSAEEVVGVELPSLRLGIQDRAFYDRLRDHLDGHQHWEGELWGMRRDGSTIPIRAALSPILDSDGAVTSYMVMLTDISERRRAVEQARHQAEHDALTGLPNRILFMDRLEQALAGVARQHRQFALLFIDLDHFKAINDNHGHEVGDAVLQEVANRLRRCVRRVDTVSRLGGDEFVVLLADIGGVDQAAHVAATILQTVARPIEAETEAGTGPLTLSVSIGIAICPSDGDDPKTLLRHADVAMYHAKESGRSEFHFFSQEMNSRVTERVAMENRLRRALDNQEFELEYQPEIDIGSGRTVGFEALIRWRDPERGLLRPESFMAAAEESGLIVPIGRWVLLEACQQGRRWRDAGFPVVVAVNLSNVQFVHNDLLGYVDEALSASGLAPEFLDLEITEKTIMSGDDAVLAIVSRLRERGVQLTIDDFGTGFSSLANLRRFPLSKLKIDRSFIDDIVGAPDGATMIPAIIALARSLKLRVIAEGVETAEQLDYLQQHGCDEYQGFYAGEGRPGCSSFRVGPSAHPTLRPP